MRVEKPGGAVIDLGTTETTPTIGIVDYSRRVTDDFGVTTVVKRGFARRMSVRLALPFDEVDDVQAQLADLRATSALWIADDRFAWLQVEGFYKDFELDLAVPPTTFCRLTVEGLTETEVVADAGGDPAPAGQVSTLRLLQPSAGSPLISSSVAEADYPEWASGTSYGAEARVIKAATHRIYESVTAGNLGNDPASSIGQWIDIGPTNRWAMFDQSLGTITTANASIVVQLTAAMAVALLDVTASTVRVQASGYDQTQSASGGTVTFLDLPPASGPITVTIGGAGQVSVGTVVVGTIAKLGVTEAAPTAGINDYSRKVVDEFGEATVVQRAWAKRMTVRALIRTEEIDRVANRVAAVRGRPSLWIGEAGLDSLTIYGFFKEFSIDVGETVSNLSLNVEGLSKAAPLAPGSLTGPAGLNNATVTLYQRAASAPAVPSVTTTYTFATGVLSSIDNGWGQTIPAANGSPLYATSATASSAETTDTIATGEWAGVVVMAQDGAPGGQGEAGLNAATVFLYKRSATVPAVPSTTATYTFTTGVLTGHNNGWSQSVPAGTDPVYITTASAAATNETDTIAAGEWASPNILAQNGAGGAPGADGLNNATVTVYKRSATVPPVPSVTTSYTFATGALAALNNGWTQSVPATNGNPLYATVATASSAGATDTIGSGEWAAPVILAQDGSGGAAGLNVATAFLYKRAAAPPPVPSTIATFTFASGVLTGHNNGWSQSLPSGTDPVYVTTATASSTGASDTIAAGEWASPNILAQNGATGPGGPVIALVTDAQAFKFVDNVQAPAGQLISFNVVKQNTSEGITWTTSPTVTIGVNGDFANLHIDNFGANRQVTITATGNTSGVKDTLTLVRLDQSTADSNATRNEDGANMIPSPVLLDRAVFQNGAFFGDAAGSGRPVEFGKRIHLPSNNSLVFWESSSTAMPAVPGERLFVSHAATHPGSITTDYVELVWEAFTTSGAALGGAVVIATVITGSEVSAAGGAVTKRGSFITPAGTAFVKVYTARRGAAHANNFLVSEPFLGRHQAGADVTSDVAALGDGNRLRFTQFEAGLRGWTIPANNGSGLGAGIFTGDIAGKKYGQAYEINFTATGQAYSIATATSDKALMPRVNGNERLAISAALQVVCAADETWSLTVGWVDAGGTYLSSSTAVSGTGPLSLFTTVGGFVTAPSNAANAFLELYLLNTVTGNNHTLTIAEPMLCSAGPNQVVLPKWSPGPSSESGADVTLAIKEPAASTEFKYSSGGVAEGGQFNRDFQLKLLSQGGEVTSGITWTYKVLTGGFNGNGVGATGTIAGGGTTNFTVTSIASNSNVIEVTAAYKGKTTVRSLDLTKFTAAPGGGTLVSKTSGFTAISTTTYVDVTGPLLGTIPAGKNAAAVQVVLDAMPASGGTGFWTVQMQVQRLIAGTWTDLGGSVSTNSDWNAVDVSGSQASIVINISDTGLTAGTTYEWRVLGRLTSGARGHNVTGYVMVTA